MQPIVLQQHHYAHQCMQFRNLAKCTPPTTSSNQTISTLHPHISASTRLPGPTSNIISHLCFNTIEFSVNSAKHSTRTLSLVQNRVKFLKNLQNKYISIQRRGWGGERGVETQKCTIVLVLNSFSSCFDPLFPFFLSASTAATNSFTAPTCTTTIITYLEPCALNAEFQHFIPRFNKISLLCGPHSKRR